MTAEALRKGGTGCSIEECRHGMIRHGAQAGTGKPVVINNSSTVS